MTRPHDFSRETAPIAYLKREYVEPIPRQVTFCCMVGAYRIFVLDLSEHHSSMATEAREAIIAEAIQGDVSSILRLRGTVSHYILVVDDKTIARYGTDGQFIDYTGDIPLPSAGGGARLKGKNDAIKLR